MDTISGIYVNGNYIIKNILCPPSITYQRTKDVKFDMISCYNIIHEQDTSVNTKRRNKELD